MAKKYHQDQRGISASVNNYSLLFETHFFSNSTQKGIKPYKCDSCDATFARKAHMRRHNESIHQGIRRKPLNCDNCEFVCYKKATMENHQEQEKHFKIEKIVEHGVLVVQISSKRPLKNSSWLAWNFC